MYYEGNPIMSDEAFDRLAEQHGYTSVGYDPGQDSIAHSYRMYSLQKVYTDEKYPELGKDLVITPKLDGAAVSLTYIEGKLSLGLTRGDGILGKDITENMKQIVPARVKLETMFQVTGEVVAPKDIPNARNYAAGALGLKDPEEFNTRQLTFIAYDAQPSFFSGDYIEDLTLLGRMGFYIVTQSDWKQFPQDGVVFRVNNREQYEKMGYTSKHPRGAFALKERKKGKISKLLDVIWQVGKSGVVSPVAILEPVDIDGAKVSRATLHNMKYIEDLDLEIGCNVEVIRSGEIIPRVVSRVD